MLMVGVTVTEVESELRGGSPSLEPFGERSSARS